MSRPAYVYALAVVGAFVALGAGVGLAANFTLGFFIEQFVEPGESPMDSIQVGMMLLVAIFLSYALGPVAAGVAGIGVGQAMPDRELTAGVVSGAGSFAGFYPFVGLSLFFTLSVLAEYGTGPTGGGGGGPLDPAGLLSLMVQVSLPVGLVGMATGYLTSRVSGGTREAGATAIEDDDMAAQEDEHDAEDGHDAEDEDGGVGVDDDVPARRERDGEGQVATTGMEPPADG